MSGRNQDQVGNVTGGGAFQTPGDMGNRAADQEQVELKTALDAGLGDELLQPLVSGNLQIDEAAGLQQALDATNDAMANADESQAVDPANISNITILITDPAIQNTYLASLNCEERRVGLLIHSETPIYDLMLEGDKIPEDEEFLRFLKERISITKLEGDKLGERVGDNSFNFLTQMVLVEIARRQMRVKADNLETDLAGILSAELGGRKVKLIDVMCFHPRIVPINYDECKDGLMKEMGFVREEKEASENDGADNLNGSTTE